MIYEMAAGRELQHLIPREDEDEEQANFKNDYKDVKDEGCKEILRYIFARKDNGQLQRSIKEVI